MGGTGVASSHYTSAAFINPALLTHFGESDDFGFIFPLDSDLVDPVNFAIDEMRDSGFLDELGEKYFTDAFSVTYDDIEEVG